MSRNASTCPTPADHYGILKVRAEPAVGSGRRAALWRWSREVADYLGNTPTVARASYVDPRVLDLYRDRTTIAKALSELGEVPSPQDALAQEVIEAAVLEMLRTGAEPDEVLKAPTLTVGGVPATRRTARPKARR